MASFLALHNEDKENTQIMKRILVGGGNFHLRLVCSLVIFAIMSQSAPYIRPDSPGVIIILPSATQFQIVQLQDQHQESTILFREVNV